MNCDEKQRLMNAYEAATSQYSKAVTECQQKLGISTQDKYRELQRTAEQARLDSEKARRELETHAKSHGC
jgi:uncharacterized protein YjcR